MRVRCPACSAPYFLPESPPPGGPRCPNCDAPAPAPDEPRRVSRPRSEPEPEGRSRVVTVVGLLHLLTAAGGLFVTVGLTAVIGEHGVTGRSALAIALVAGLTFTWVVAGIGILARWTGAWYISLVLVPFTLLGTLVRATYDPCGAIFTGLMCLVILVVMIGRRDEFR